MEFKKLSDVEVVAEPTESANVLIEENGVIKKAPKAAVGGAGGDSVITFTVVVDYSNNNAALTLGSYDDIINKFRNKEPIIGFCTITDYSASHTMLINNITIEPDCVVFYPTGEYQITIQSDNSVSANYIG